MWLAGWLCWGGWHRPPPAPPALTVSWTGTRITSLPHQPCQPCQSHTKYPPAPPVTHKIFASPASPASHIQNIRQPNQPHQSHTKYLPALPALPVTYKIFASPTSPILVVHLAGTTNHCYHFSVSIKIISSRNGLLHCGDNQLNSDEAGVSPLVLIRPISKYTFERTISISFYYFYAELRTPKDSETQRATVKYVQNLNAEQKDKPRQPLYTHIQPRELAFLCTGLLFLWVPLAQDK